MIGRALLECKPVAHGHTACYFAPAGLGVGIAVLLLLCVMFILVVHYGDMIFKAIERKEG